MPERRSGVWRSELPIARPISTRYPLTRVGGALLLRRIRADRLGLVLAHREREAASGRAERRPRTSLDRRLGSLAAADPRDHDSEPADGVGTGSGCGDGLMALDGSA